MGFQRNDVEIFEGSRQLNLSGINDIQSVSDSAPSSALRDGDLRSGSSWVVLTEPRKSGPILAGVLHLENGKWRVVSGPVQANTPIAMLGGFFGGAVPDPGAQQTAAATVPIDKLVAARDAGARYLRNWAQNRPDALLKQTSHFSFSYARNLADYKKMQERRPDQGNCSLNPGDAFTLEPIPHLTGWEQKWLDRLAFMHGMAVGNGFASNQQAFISTGDGPPTTAKAKMPVLLLLQYASPSGRFVMELVQEKGAWKVIEPAMPM